MQITKLLSSLLVAGLLAVPALSQQDDAERQVAHSFDDELSAAGNSVRARAALLLARDILDRRGSSKVKTPAPVAKPPTKPPTKAPAKEPAKTSSKTSSKTPTKQPTTGTKGGCDAKKSKTPKRTSVTVDAGELKTAGCGDQISTYGVKNCVVVGAYEAQSGCKIMAHINGVNAADKTYEQQLADFEAMAKSRCGTQPAVYMRKPNAAEWKDKLSPDAYGTLGRMIDEIESRVHSIAGAGGAHVIPARSSNGDMNIAVDGKVNVD